MQAEINLGISKDLVECTFFMIKLIIFILLMSVKIKGTIRNYDNFNYLAYRDQKYYH